MTIDASTHINTSRHLTMPRAGAVVIRVRRALLTLFMLGASSLPAYARDGAKLEDLINQFRTSSPACDGKPVRRADALVADPALARLPLSKGEQLNQALKQAGIKVARAEAITLSGPPSAAAAMAAIKNRYCRTLVQPEFTRIGVSHDAATWKIILAQPLLSPTLGTSEEAGRKVLELVNAARSTPRVCGNQRYPAARRLSWNDKLAKAALAHSSDMAKRNYFQHKDHSGGTVVERARHAGYRWRLIGENIAAGQGSPQEVVTGWLSSPGHCANIMNPDFAGMGAAYATSQTSDAGIYWTQVFGTPR